MAEKFKLVKNRYWATIAYPESVNPNFKEILQKTGLKCIISPLHDKDINEQDEEQKKPHWHILILWDNPTTFNAAKNICNQIGAIIPQPINSFKGAYRYLTHKDNPEKFQYDEADIISMNGFNISDYVEFTRSEILKLKSEIFNIVRLNDILEYCDLIDYLEKNERLELLDCASSNTILFNNYVTSRRHKKGN